MIGTKLAHYEITSHLGSGGMDVYQATDTKLGRSVAVKLLPEAFSHDSERVARFQREARVLASLNHSNIAAIYGVEESADRKLLVMELVGGETLAERVKRGPIPVDESLQIATQICEALEAAHEKGIIHRDLKPANIKVTPDGKVKVLDFGLAKAFVDDGANVNLSNSPTISMAATNAGVILGTASYMSPEQAKGKTVDRRTDIFAFGCVLYEMLTGKRAFDGENAAETLSRVLQRDPDWKLLPPNLPHQIWELLRLCLEKDLRKRRRDAGDVLIDIQEALTVRERTTAPAEREKARWIIVVVCLIAIAALSGPAFRHLREVPVGLEPEIWTELNTPAVTDPVSFAISPDGRRLVFTALNGGKSQLWVRALDSTAEVRPLQGTDNATFPFWSPDSASIGFFNNSKLQRMDLVGGAPRSLADAVAGRGGTWNRDGVIVFSPTNIGPLFKVPATGGEAVAVTQLETGQPNHTFPKFLPDGRHFIYTSSSLQANSTVYIGSLEGGSPKKLITADSAVVVSPLGFLFFLRKTTLFAQAFNFAKQELSDNPVAVAENVSADLRRGGAIGLSAESNLVAYRTGAPVSFSARQLSWLDREGKTLNTIGSPEATAMGDVELSPDGRRVAVNRTVEGNPDVWITDAARWIPSRFSFDRAIDQHPLWSPDGSRIIFQTYRTRVGSLFIRLSNGAGQDEPLLSSDQITVANDWSPDGRFLLFRSTDPRTSFDLWILPMSGEKKPFVFLKTPFEEKDGQFSPDGRWIAYQSNETGRSEIYVLPFPGPGGKFQISTNGGAQARWNKNGKEIFYISLDNKMMSAPVKLSSDGQSVETGTPTDLFPVRIAGGPLFGTNKQQYAVSPDGQRFLVNVDAGATDTSSLTVINHWKPKPK